MAGEFAEGPQIVPDEIVGEGDFGGDDFADGEAPAQGARVAEEEQHGGVDDGAAGADDAKAHEGGSFEQVKADAEEMLEILHANRGGMLAGAFGAFAELGDFGDSGDVAASENFDEDFVSQGCSSRFPARRGGRRKNRSWVATLPVTSGGLRGRGVARSARQCDARGSSR